MGTTFEFMDYEELKVILKPLKLKNKYEYYQWWNENEEYCFLNKIPRNPDVIYSKSFKNKK